MNKIDYNHSLPQEDEHLEYKKSKNAFPKDAWETISAFENTDGGFLVLGVEELANHEFKISGVNDTTKVLDDFWSNITNKNKINYSTIKNNDIKIIPIANKKIIEITIRQADDTYKPIYINGNFAQAFIRQGSTDRKCTEDYIKRLSRLSESSLDTKVAKNYDIDDLDLDSIELYKKVLTKIETYKRYKDYELKDFLRRIGVLIKDRDNDGKEGISYAGLLFFGKNNAIIQKFPYFSLEYYDKSHPEQERWTSRISSVESDLNIFTFFIKVIEHFKATVPNPFSLDKNGQRRDTFGSMFVALREATVNMLMHADYFEGSRIILTEYPKFYKFENPGKMKIPKEDFFTTHNSKSRNAIISKLFTQAHYGEREGVGGEKIFNSSIENNFRHPEIETSIEKGTQLKIWKVDYANSFSGKEISNRERKVLKAIISSPSGSLSHKEIESQTGFSRYIADSTLSSLLSKKIIEIHGKSRSTKYTLPSTTEQLAAQMQSLSGIFRQLIKNSNSSN
ncbi:putative DNA binding domain-containing protein [Lactobacillus sp. ESL0731]|uniref:RNA-binding domain-containing protein n=1 Tax=unclassified Lactobacillus TaxID=2620435 RepID=UPI0023F7E35F|nr:MULTISPECIES: RNA-binding domain-containing protein [unclassified Lactobacillus]WEV51238.1 putative DNA binding domain-containing protein [Lactobacillus sp. ESL0700]WEV62368.1 putative DNA binding domain-containing protein [Lactobacillus sp. ESL0731]